MRSITLLGLVLAIGLLSTPASADYVVFGTQTSQPNGTDFNYMITLTNASTSTMNVGTFWFSWVPGQDFMTNSPISEISPTGWTEMVTHAGINDGFAIQWVASSAAFDLTPGNSLTFGFTSAETPAQLAGNSQFFPATPEGTAFVYSGRPFSDAGFQFVVTPLTSVPEPSSMLLIGIGGTMVSVLQFRRLKARIALATQAS
jgi:PEP-CTERM motif